MREAQAGLIVIGLLLCVLVYVAFYRLTNRSSRFDEMSRSVAVAEAVDEDPYRAHSIGEIEKRRQQRFNRDTKEPFAAVEEFSSRLDASPFQRKSSDQKVAQATHLSPHSKSEDRIAKREFVGRKSAKSAASEFVATVKREPALPASTELPSNLTGFEVAKKSNRAKPPKVKPPVLESKFGGVASQHFIPAKILREKVTENNTSGFSAAPSLPFKADTNSALKVLPKPQPKPSVSGAVDKILMRQLPISSGEDQSNSFMPQSFTPKKQADHKKSNFSQLPEIAQASALEPVKKAAAAVLDPTPPFNKAPRKVGRTYTTRTGDSLWTIAQAVYGDGRYFRALHRVNQDTLSLSESIPVGTVLRVSKMEELHRDHPELCPKQGKKSHSQDQPDTADTVSTGEEELDHRFYVTEDGDTLFEIARQRLGQASRYLEIHELNRFRIPETANHLTPLGGGIELLLPE